MNLFEEYKDYITSENVQHYEARFDEGPLTDLVALAEAILAIDPLAELDVPWDEPARIKWKRTLRPEEIAKRERDAATASAARAAKVADEERATYERLRAKFEGRPLKETRDE